MARGGIPAPWILYLINHVSNDDDTIMKNIDPGRLFSIQCLADILFAERCETFQPLVTFRTSRSSLPNALLMTAGSGTDPARSRLLRKLLARSTNG
jgi:hypothetical protein